MDYGLQLYSIKEKTQENFFKALDDVAKVGYKFVEFAGYGDIKAVDMNKHLKSVGLKAISSHVSIELLNDKLDYLLDYNETIGSKGIVVAYSEIKTKDDTLRLADWMNEKAEKICSQGFTLGYHNHDFEFKKDGEEYLYDILVNNIDTNKIKLELDLYWVSFAGLDIHDTIDKYKNKINWLHIKQMKDKESKENTEIGKGILDFKKVIKDSKKIGIKNFIVEQEFFTIDQIESIKESVDYLNSLNL